MEGIDKPGIIASVASEVARQRGNITDLSQTILAGVFVMVLVVDMRGTDGYDATDALRALADTLQLGALELRSEDRPGFAPG